ncbi:hypothetical protein MKW92_034116, partial [Papaver armeniacum]
MDPIINQARVGTWQVLGSERRGPLGVHESILNDEAFDNTMRFLMNRGINPNNQGRSLFLDTDNMSYEELLELMEAKSGGLSEKTIL